MDCHKIALNFLGKGAFSEVLNFNSISIGGSERRRSVLPKKYQRHEIFVGARSIIINYPY